MNRKVNQIKDLETIEKELNKAHVGILAYYDDKEKINQVVTSFVYVDKNIYVFYNEDENFTRIVFDNNVNFSLYKEEKISNESELDFNPAYKFNHIWCNGIIKKVGETKIMDEIVKAYCSKYNLDSEADKNLFEKLLIIDTEEIQAGETFGS